MSKFLLNNEGSHFYEHQGYNNPVVIDESDISIENKYFQSNIKKCCLKVIPRGDKKGIELSYYVGIDWVNKEYNKAIYIQPKLNKTANQTDYLQMLFSGLKHNGVVDYTNELFEIKWDDPQITIEQHQDLLTPLLIVQFLSLVKQIVRKGLKKSYYRVESNLYGKVKGKVLVGQTIKHNVLKNKNLNTYCQYEEFGLNGLENRLLKKALVFVQRYMPAIANLNSTAFTTALFNYINPAFEFISDEVNLNEVKQTKTNVFYKEYEEAIKLAKLILKRFGYNVNSTQDKKVKTPPFWIDMSKLFELYVLGLLKDSYGNEVKYQFQGNYGQPDFILTKQQIVVDAKYKTYYKHEFNGQEQWQRDNIADDIRQVSGYGRDKKILNILCIKENQHLIYVPKCLIVYPDQKKDTKIDNHIEIKEFVNVYKVPVLLPTIQKK